ncbi:MAG: GNAT family N-acetyltransferase [Blastocatellia bacterium]|nr:GNAT family N-acetyltransferase [Blastocatellia bacterium]
MKIRRVVPSDFPEWLRMRDLLWPGAPEDHEREIIEFFEKPNPDLATFVIDCGGNRLGGFVETNIRDYAEGCSSGRIGYIEGWYVDDPLRRQGWGGRLLQAAEDWARELGLSEMASDCDIANEVSLLAHTALGYEEVERVICFRKSLDGTP